MSSGIGYLPITDATALLIAYAKGFFKDEGLEAEKPTLIRSWPALVESFAAAKFNIVHLLKPIPIWMRYNNKFPAKIMAWGAYKRVGACRRSARDGRLLR